MLTHNDNLVEVSAEHLEFLKKLKRRKHLILFTQIFVLIKFFALWETAANLQWIDAFIFSQPSRILNTFMTMMADSSLLMHTGVTMGEVIAGFLLSTILGTIIAIVLWWNGFLERVANPYLVVLNSLPKTALAPIIIVWVGNNVRAVIATAVMTAVVVTILTLLSGFLETSKDKIKLIYAFGGSKMQVLLKVVLPSSIPSFINALKITIGLSFVGTIVGEFLVANAGLGFLIVYGSQIFRMDLVMLSIMILCVLSAGMYQLIAFFERRYMR